MFSGTSETSAALTAFGATTQKSLQDPNTLILRAFDKQIPIESEKIYNLIMQKITESKKASPTPTTSAVSEADELEKFKKLMDNGVITPAEFEQKKKQILGL